MNDQARCLNKMCIPETLPRCVAQAQTLPETPKVNEMDYFRKYLGALPEGQTPTGAQTVRTCIFNQFAIDRLPVMMCIHCLDL